MKRTRLFTLLAVLFAPVAVRAANDATGLDFTSKLAAPAPRKPAPSAEGDPMAVDPGHVPPALSKAIERAVAGAYPKAPPEAAERLRKGFIAVEAHDWKGARADFETALKLDPKNADLQKFVTLADGVTPDTDAAVNPAVPSPSDAELAEFFSAFREGRPCHPSAGVRRHVLSLNRAEFHRLMAVRVPLKEDDDLPVSSGETPARPGKP